ncbi:uncharacterized protein [Venturia canescens]|uniref:uncharacterized protein n=1 Tax=Venturia canescens TaxID=32260 RepID=UPI001C9CF4E1|nr:uncharacterized protein LOC122407150 [Venturia canescens]
MSVSREDCTGFKVETESTCECIKCGKFTRRPSKISTHTIFDKCGDSARISAKQIESNYVTRIVHAGIRNDNVYEVKLLLAPGIDVSTVKITVKSKNLRVKLHRSLGELARRLPLSIHEKSPLNELIKKAVTHYENFLIPESIDGDKVRAIVDNKNRVLVLTAPTIKPCKALRRRFSMMLDN